MLSQSIRIADESLVRYESNGKQFSGPNCVVTHILVLAKHLPHSKVAASVKATMVVSRSFLSANVDLLWVARP